MKKWSIETLSLVAVLAPLAVLFGLTWYRASLPHMATVQLDITLLALLTIVIGIILRKIHTLMVLHNAAYALLQCSEMRYRDIIDTSHEGIWLLDDQARITFANLRLATMLGYDVSEQLGRSVNDFLGHGVDADSAPFRPQDSTTQQLRDLRYRNKDGSLVWAMVGSEPMQDEHGRFMGTLVMATDITKRKLAEQALSRAHLDLERRVDLRTAELLTANALLLAEIDVRKAAEQALAQSEERLQEIITMMPVALFLKDADSRILLTNEACDNQWGVRSSDIVGSCGSAHFPAQQMTQFLANDQAAFAARRMLVSEELCWNSQQQESRLMQTFKKPIFNAEGKPHLLIGMYVDINERKLAEEALQHSYTQLRQLSDHQESIKEDERRRIALDIHDDLGQNLMALKIDISLLHERTGQTHPRLHRQVQRVLNTIDQTIKSVRLIINDLHPSTLELGLCPAVEWQLTQFERRSAIVCTLTVLDDSANASMNQRHTAALFRIIQEALTNIERHAKASAVVVTLKLTSASLSVVIADNGIGIAPDDYKKKTSFGLKGIQGRVDSLSGQFQITSDGDGTTLAILIPGSASGLPAGAPCTPDAAQRGAVRSRRRIRSRIRSGILRWC
ncbi:MAG: two-component system sensor histidine kinase UhpB [Janthinobacterium sp.]|jgi:two-component system sensor histidine kinase UhpB